MPPPILASRTRSTKFNWNYVLVGLLVVFLTALTLRQSPTSVSQLLIDNNLDTGTTTNAEESSSSLTQNEQTYDLKYWKWQESMNKFGAAYKGDILRYLLGAYRHDGPLQILEFGCSGGYILDSLKATDRTLYGVEINPAARAFAKDTFASTIRQVYVRPEQMPADLRFDFIFTTSVLEHADCPLCELRKLRTKMLPDGVLVVGLKNDGADPSQGFDKFEKEPNHHIYTWNALLLANMLKSSGFRPCNVIGQFDAWHAIDVDAYQRDKFGYCQKGLQVGQTNSVQNLWAVAVKDDAPTDACSVYKPRLENIRQCQYLKS